MTAMSDTCVLAGNIDLHRLRLGSDEIRFLPLTEGFEQVDHPAQFNAKGMGRGCFMDARM